MTGGSGSSHCGGASDSSHCCCANLDPSFITVINTLIARPGSPGPTWSLLLHFPYLLSRQGAAGQLRSAAGAECRACSSLSASSNAFSRREAASAAAAAAADAAAIPDSVVMVPRP